MTQVQGWSGKARSRSSDKVRPVLHSTVPRSAICQPHPLPEPPDGEPQSTPAKTGEPTVSLSKKPKEEVSVSVMGYHGDGNLATAHLVQPILEEDRPRVVANRKNIKRVTIGRDRRKGVSHCTSATGRARVTPVLPLYVTHSCWWWRWWRWWRWWWLCWSD